MQLLGRQLSLADYAQYLDWQEASNSIGDEARTPRSPEFAQEVERYVARPLYVHDVPVQVFCPDKAHEWTAANILGANDSLFPVKRSHVFWGPRGSQAYPLHANDVQGAGPILKYVASGRQEVAIFPRSQAANLRPFDAADAENPKPAAMFRADALEIEEHAAQSGDYIHAKGFRDEVNAGEILAFMGNDLHEFRNPVAAFSIVFSAA
jgi:hypothetical protein